MSEINILSPHVADLIAAGEVVERPASVIKELIENSFDAGSGNVTVEIKDGGMTYIRVTDDGLGMLPEDAGLCFTRHATSKLRDEHGLEAIGTMGFRGEALAAISAVSRTELLTRKRGENEGTRVLVEGGDIVSAAPCGCPEGTTLIVRDLFHNTPARLKFMKTDRAEASACVNTALRCALGRPEASVRLIKDGTEEFFSPGDGKKSSCCYSLLGRDAAKELIECEAGGDGVAVLGFVGSPNAGRGSRARQFFFCNGRSIKSQLLQAAVEQAYKNRLLTGRYPSCVIYLTLSFGAVDVNVHPSKTEVKFRDEKKIFDAVYYAALAALEGEGKTAEIKLSPSTNAAAAPKKDFYKSMSAGEFREKYSGTHNAGRACAARSAEAVEASVAPQRGMIVWNRTPSGTSNGTEFHESVSPYRTSAQAPERDSGKVRAVSAEPAAASKASPDETENVLADVNAGFRLVGEAMKTYIIIEKDEELILIDKHAAHERMIFDRLKSEGREIMSQSLLVPVTVRLPGPGPELIEENSDTLAKLGFEIEPYGDDSVVVRSVPADTDACDIVPMVEEICEKLEKGAPGGDRLDSILHTVACKAAVKAGWDTQDGELLEIAEAVVSGEVKYCPHGRPVAVTLTKKQLDKEFSRIV